MKYTAFKPLRLIDAPSAGILSELKKKIKKIKMEEDDLCDSLTEGLGLLAEKDHDKPVVTAIEKIFDAVSEKEDDYKRYIASWKEYKESHDEDSGLTWKEYGKKKSRLAWDEEELKKLIKWVDIIKKRDADECEDEKDYEEEEEEEEEEDDSEDDGENYDEEKAKKPKPRKVFKTKHYDIVCIEELGLGQVVVCLAKKQSPSDIKLDWKLGRYLYSIEPLVWTKDIAKALTLDTKKHAIELIESILLDKLVEYGKKDCRYKILAGLAL